jgi:DNA-binding beta-propeller fold protein YncE
MGIIRIPKRDFKPDLQIDFTKGFALSAKADNEAELFQNIELDRDGSIQSRLGCFKHNTNDLGGLPILGFGRQYFGVSVTDTIVAAQGNGGGGGSYQWTVAPYFVAAAWSQFGSNYDGMYDPVVSEACTLLDETPILVFANINYTTLEYWDGSAGTAVTIAGSPANASLLRFSTSRLYASGIAANPTRVYYSDQSDPTSWPSENFFDILPNRGRVMGLEVSAGTGTTLNIATDRSWQAMYGDPSPGGGFSLQPVQDGFGCDTPRGIVTLGSITLSPWRGDLYIYTGSVQDISEPYRGITMSGEFNPAWQGGGTPSPNFGNLTGIFVDTVNNEVFVTSQGNNAVYVFNRSDSLGSQPIRTITGGSTLLNSPSGVWVNNVTNQLFVSNLLGTFPVIAFPRTATGNLNPTTIFTNAFAANAVSVFGDIARGELLVTGFFNAFWVFRMTASEANAPLRTVAGGATLLATPFGGTIDTVNHEIVIANSVGGTGSGSVTVYPQNANGNVAPSRTITGASTNLSNPSQPSVDTANGVYWIANSNNQSVTAYDRLANGNAAPLQDIVGGLTLLNNPLGVFVDTVNGAVWVTDSGNGSVTVYPQAGTGNIPPSQIIVSASPTPAMALQASQKQSYGALTPWHMWFRPCMNTTPLTDTPAPTNDLPTILYCIDRERSGWFSLFIYPPNSGMGASNPWQAVCYGVDTNLFLAGGDGNIYLQPMRTLAQPDILGVLPMSLTAPNFVRYTQDTAPGGSAGDGNGVNVTATYRSRFREQGNPNAIKQARDIFFAGSCVPGTASVVVSVMDTSGNFQKYAQTAVQTGVPSMLTIPLAGLANYARIQVQISAQNLYLLSYSISFRTKFISGQFSL